MTDEIDWAAVNDGVRKGVNSLLQRLNHYRRRETTFDDVSVALSEEFDDVVQSAMVKALTYRNFQGKSLASTWGYRIGRNAALDWLKAYKSNARYVVRESQQVSMEGHWSDLYDREYEDDPSEHLDDDIEEYAAVVFDRVIRNASREWIQTLVDRDLNEMQYNDIAKKRGCPIGTVQSSLHRVRRLMEPAVRKIEAECGRERCRLVLRHTLVLLRDWLTLTGV